MSRRVSNMSGEKRKVSKVNIVADKGAAHTLLQYCPDIENWPKSWSYEESDLAPGHLVVEFFKPFLLHLLARNLAASTLRRHRDHLWMLAFVDAGRRSDPTPPGGSPPLSPACRESNPWATRRRRWPAHLAPDQQAGARRL
ncbi:hypothetical protein CARN8_4350001 [mine drainage metagenome]|uniref:Uncharacterized protein n=1 Tax=mine drainage metagenome TaxID=410659 RepID=A0A3P3ZQ04_9ZZZZ